MKRHVGIVVIGCFVMAGCHGSEGRVAGVLLKKGQHISLTEEEQITITLLATDPKAEITQADADYDPADGTFKVHGPVRDGIPPGEYRIVLRWTASDEEDRFQGVFSEENTPLSYTVVAGKAQEIVIDVDEKTVMAR